MRFSLSFSSLAASLFLVLLIQNVEATPLPKRHTKSVTLPLKRVPQVDRGIHPLVAIQQQINRADKRLARMTNREAPSHADLVSRLQKRVDVLHEAGELNKRDKRYNRIGFLPKQSKRFYRPAPVTNDVETNSFLVGEGEGRNRHSGNRHHRVSGAAKNCGTNTEVVGAGDAVVDNEATGDAPEVVEEVPNLVDPASNTTIISEGLIGGPVSEIDVEIADTPEAEDSLALNVEGPDIGYLATVPIGTPPVNFLILMDSGSADFWVGSDDCQSDRGGSCGNHQFLGASSSDTFVDSGAEFQVTYGTGQVSGRVIQDTIDVAGLPLEGHTFGVADIESIEFSEDTTAFDGLMGLARSGLSQQRTLTPVESLAENGLIDAPITSYKIARAADDVNDGEITFGALDETKFDPATLVTLENVSPLGFYQAAMDTVSVDGADVGLQDRAAIIDTGTSLIIAPEADVELILSNVAGASEVQGFRTVPCDTDVVLSLTFGGQVFEIQPEDFSTGQQLEGNNCLSGLQPGNIGGANEWLVGAVFLKNAYFSTNAETGIMQLAKLV